MRYQIQYQKLIKKLYFLDRRRGFLVPDEGTRTIPEIFARLLSVGEVPFPTSIPK